MPGLAARLANHQLGQGGYLRLMLSSMTLDEWAGRIGRSRVAALDRQSMCAKSDDRG